MTHRVIVDDRLYSVLCAALPLVSCIAGTNSANAQTASPATTDARAPPTSIRAKPSSTIITEDDIVVTAPYGAAAVKPETELNEEDIALYGADSIRDLIQRIKPLIDGSGREPVLLVNGKRVGSVSGIAGFPPEALNRLEILPPEAAAHYGYPSNQRVVNLALKKHFISWQVETGLTLATAGGRDSERLAVSRVVIDGPVYWNAQAQMLRDSRLLKSERQIPRPSAMVGPASYIVRTDGGGIDPAFSRPVVQAGIPPGAASRPPGLADFVATAGLGPAGNPDAFETLLPSAYSQSFNAGVTRPLGSFSGSLNINASRSGTSQLLGLPIAGDAALIRSFDGEHGLRNDQRSEMLGLSLLVSGLIGSWQTALTTNYSVGRSRTLFERGIDQTGIQKLIDLPEPSFNPYGPRDRSLLPAERNRSRNQSLNVQLNVTKPVLTLPAGAVIANFAGTANSSGSTNIRVDRSIGSEVRNRLRQNRFTAMQSVSIPVASRSAGVLAPLGDLSVDLSATIEAGTAPGLRPQFNGSLNWSPFSFLQLSGSYGYAEMAPTVDQLNGPRVEIVNRIYDFVRREMAEPVWISGGNPDLQKGSRRSLSLNGSVRPFGNQRLTLNVGYQRLTASGGVGSFPGFTPAIEVAFPERIIRDASGRLIAIDARPINIVRDVTEQLTSSLVLLVSTPPGAGRIPAPGARKATMADPLQLSLSLNHSWQLRSELLTRPGLPPLDRLRGDGGQPRHNVSLQLVAGKRGIGATLTGNWQGAARVRGGTTDGSGDFRYPAMMQFNLGLFVEPERLEDRNTGKNWLSNLKFAIDIENLFNSYRRVELDDGSVPDGYSRHEIDPLGRTIRLSIRKRF